LLNCPACAQAAARTMLDEVLQQRVDMIEYQLAHAIMDS
jgi:hypothetical protein